MKEIGISGYPHLQGGKETEEDYSVACTFEDAEIIVFHKIPKRQYGLIESWAEEIIEHETIHIVLHQLRLKEAGHNFDNFFPHLSALWDFKENPVRFIKQHMREKRKP